MQAISISNINLLDTFFIRWYFIIYYAYMMSVNVLIPKGGIYGVIVNVLLLGFLVIATIKRVNYCKKFGFIYLYILFYFVLILLQSSDYLYSYTNLIKYSLGLLCLPLGFSIISSVHRFRELLKTGLILVGMYLVYITLANILNFGDFYGYGADDGLNIGNVFSDGLYLNVYVITSIFLLLAMFPKKRWLIVIMLAICSIITIVNMKRTVIAVLLLGIVSFALLIYVNSKREQTRLISKYLQILLIAVVCVAPFFAGFFYSNFEARESRFNDDYEVREEGRITEFIAIADETFNSQNPATILFGKETLNYVGTYAGGAYGNRMIHNDYAKIIHGTGLMGVLAWFSVYVYLVLYMLKLSKGIKYQKNTFSLYLFALFFAYLIIYIISMFSGVMGIVLSSSYFYASTGAILRLFYNKSNLNIINNKICKFGFY